MKLLSLFFPPSIKNIRQESPLAYVLVRHRPVNNYWAVWLTISSMLYLMIYFIGNRVLYRLWFVEELTDLTAAIVIPFMFAAGGIFIVVSSLLFVTRDLRVNPLGRELFTVPTSFASLRTMVDSFLGIHIKGIMWCHGAFVFFLILGALEKRSQFRDIGEGTYVIGFLALAIFTYNYHKTLWLIGMRSYFEGPHCLSVHTLVLRSLIHPAFFFTSLVFRHFMIFPLIAIGISGPVIPLSFCVFILAELGATWRLRNLEKRMEEDFALIADKPVPRHFFDEETKPGFFITGDPAGERSEILGYPPFRLYRGGLRKVNDEIYRIDN